MSSHCDRELQPSSLCLKRASEWSTVAGDTSLEEPLLAPSQSDVDSDALPTSSIGHENSERAIVPRSINKYDWEQLWRALIQGCVQSCASVWSKLNFSIKTTLSPGFLLTQYMF